MAGSPDYVPAIGTDAKSIRLTHSGKLGFTKMHFLIDRRGPADLGEIAPHPPCPGYLCSTAACASHTRMSRVLRCVGQCIPREAIKGHRDVDDPSDVAPSRIHCQSKLA
jgi:hypothetical protein